MKIRKASAAAADPVGSVSGDERDSGTRCTDEAAARSRAIDDAYDEYCELIEAGETPCPEEFCARYPRIETSLLECVRLHHEMEINPLAVPTKPAKPRDLTKSAIKWPLPGTQFLHLRLLRELGRGAFSRVFLAEEPALGNRRVVVKIAPNGGREAQTQGRLDHPNIVPIYSVEEDPASELAAVCMPYQGRATLCDVLDSVFRGVEAPTHARVILDAVKGPVEREGAAEPDSGAAAVYGDGSYCDGIAHIALQLAEALKLVHARDIFHLDLKPSNVLMTPDGKPMLLDFNLARDARLGDTPLGGTLMYMSPEHLRASARDGDWGAVDARSDLFSLGVILYELLTGSHPFGRLSVKLADEETRLRMLKRLPAGPVPITKANPRVDRPLAGIIERCLAHEPGQRFQSAAELAAALRRRSSGRRRRSRKWLLAAVGVGLMLIAGGLSLAAIRAGERGRHLAEGQAAYRSGDFERAARSFDRALASDPSDAATYFARGRARQRMGRFDLAISDYQKADNLAPEGRLKACMAYCKSCLKEHAEAIELCTRAIEDGFNTAGIHNNLGCNFLALGRSYWSKASMHFEKAIAIDRDSWQPYYNRARLDMVKAAMARSENGSYYPRQGLIDIDKAIDLGSKTSKTHRVAASLHALAALDREPMNNRSRALDHLEKAYGLGLDTGHLEHDFNLMAVRNEARFKAILKCKPQEPRPLPKAYGLVDPSHGP